MHMILLLSALLAALPAVDAAKQGFSLGVRLASGACKLQADYEADLDAIKRHTGSTMVRISDSSECDVVPQVMPAIEAKKFHAVLGIWPDTDTQWEDGKSAVVEAASTYSQLIHAVIIGSEGLYRGTYSGTQLADRVREMRAAVPNLRYGIADTWNVLADGTADPAILESDIVLCNAFPYWQGTPAGRGAGAGVLAYDKGRVTTHMDVVTGDRDVEFWVGDTGWPTAGPTFKAAKPGMSEAEEYYRGAICLGIVTGTNIFVYEAFDRPVSAQSNGSITTEPHWGVMTSDREPKYPLRCTLW